MSATGQARACRVHVFKVNDKFYRETNPVADEAPGTEERCVKCGAWALIFVRERSGDQAEATPE